MATWNSRVIMPIMTFFLLNYLFILKISNSFNMALKLCCTDSKSQPKIIYIELFHSNCWQPWRWEHTEPLAGQFVDLVFAQCFVSFHALCQLFTYSFLLISLPTARITTWEAISMSSWQHLRKATLSKPEQYRYHPSPCRWSQPLIWHLFDVWHLCFLSMSSSRCRSFSVMRRNLVSNGFVYHDVFVTQYNTAQMLLDL